MKCGERQHSSEMPRTTLMAAANEKQAAFTADGVIDFDAASAANNFIGR